MEGDEILGDGDGVGAGRVGVEVVRPMKTAGVRTELTSTMASRVVMWRLVNEEDDDGDDVAMDEWMDLGDVIWNGSLHRNLVLHVFLKEKKK